METPGESGRLGSEYAYVHPAAGGKLISRIDDSYTVQMAEMARVNNVGPHLIYHLSSDSASVKHKVSLGHARHRLSGSCAIAWRQECLLLKLVWKERPYQLSENWLGTVVLLLVSLLIIFVYLLYLTKYILRLTIL